MDKQVIKREDASRDVLYEEAEPLFSDIYIRRKRFGRMIALVGCVVAVVLALIIRGSDIKAAWNASQSPYGDEQTLYPSGDADVSEGTEIQGGVDETEQESYESEKKDESTEREESTYKNDGGGEHIRPPVEIDMSCAEKGENYVINYTDRLFDIDGLIDRGFQEREEIGGAAPTVMIIHTHTSEEYEASRVVGFRGLNSVVSVGDRISAALNTAGLPTVHCTVIHDGDGGAGAYARARETVKTMLEIYPSVKYIIDIHRMVAFDASGSALKSVAPNGSAQMRITVGSGSLDGTSRHENLSLALALRQRLNSEDMRLCMPVVLSDSRYNGDMSRFYIMLDVGTQGNTTDEAITAGEYFADALISVLTG